MTIPMSEESKFVIDLANIGAVVALLNNAIPALAGIATIVWTLLRIYETDTVQRWLGKKKDT